MLRASHRGDVLRLMRTYPSSPRRFDPRTAPEEALRRYGFPRRPELEAHPQLARLWRRATARPIRFVEARLAIDRVLSARDPLPRVNGNNWAGASQTMRAGTDYADPATMVFAQWVIPQVWPLTPNETIKVAFWVGLDGHPMLPEPASKQVLQAGVAAQVTPSRWCATTVRYWAWTEWYTEQYQDGAVEVTNFPVHPGDEIFVVVCAPQPDFGFISMLNLTRGRGTSVGIPARPGITAAGGSAEWIVEVPPNSPHVPVFAPVTFTDCTAGSLPHGVFNLAGANTHNIRADNTPGPYGTQITDSLIALPATVTVQEVAVDWF
jgi:Peptidase A4 family